MSRTTREIRKAIATAITDTLGPDGWAESRQVGDVFPLDPHGTAHHAFAVTIPTTIPIPRDRQRRDEGAVATSTIILRWAHDLRPDGQVTDYDEALDAEATVIAAALTAYHLRPSLTSAKRAVIGDGTVVVGTVEMSLTHSWTIME